MNQVKLEMLRRKLESLAACVQSDTLALADRARSSVGGKGASELSNAPLHLGDMGSEEYSYDLDTTLLENEQHIVREAVAALRRMNDGQYGHCESCDQAIAIARLEAIPYTRFCVRCAETQDVTPTVNLNAGRPHTPRDTLAPEGEMRENGPSRRESPELGTPRTQHPDSHAAGSAGGGTAVGGLAGTNSGNGDPNVYELQTASGSGFFDSEEDRLHRETPRGGPTGGAVGGTPVFKRTR